MSKTAITLTKVTCTDGTTDYNVGINPNTNADDKVQAFVDAFKSVANNASGTCHGLPTKLILAMWGGESGWATGSTQNSNQNWSNMTYTSATNPVGNIGKGKMDGQNLKEERNMQMVLPISLLTIQGILI